MSENCFCCWRVDGFDQSACQLCGLRSQSVPDIFQISDQYKNIYGNLKKKNGAPNQEMVTLMERALLMVKLNYPIPAPMLEKIADLNS